jgi:hypothetical protein
MTVSAAEGALVVDLAVDTSAVLAVLLREPSCEGVLERLCRASQPAVAAPTRTEILLVALVKLAKSTRSEPDDRCTGPGGWLLSGRFRRWGPPRYETRGGQRDRS